MKKNKYAVFLDYFAGCAADDLLWMKMESFLKKYPSKFLIIETIHSVNIYLRDNRGQYPFRGNYPKAILKDLHQLELNEIEINIRSLLLSSWLPLSVLLGRFDEVAVLKKELSILLEGNKLKMVFEFYGRVAITRAMPRSIQLKVFPKLFQKMDLSDEWANVLFDYVSTLFSQMGLCDDMDKLKEINSLPVFKNYKSGYYVSNFFDLLDKGKGDQASKVFEGNVGRTLFDPDPHVILYLNFIKDKKEISFSKNINTAHIIYRTIKSNVLLLENKLAEALEYVDKYFLLVPNIQYFSFPQTDFLCLTYLRVALANCQLELSIKIFIKLRDERHHYMDDFFLARIYLLESKTKLAGISFRKCLEKCHQYDALNRLSLEIELAKELSPESVFWLMQNNKKDAKKESLNFSFEKKEKIGLEKMIGESELIQEIKDKVPQLSNSSVPILIRGPTGVGKEVFSRVIHECGDRSKKPFIALNCGEISDNLLQSELFGSVKGAFTGSVDTAKGVFESAEDGTVFLDEIGDISSSMQSALLRVTEENEVKPIGSSKPKAINCRILFATNVDLEKLVQQKKFRADLYYRLTRLSVVLPSLFERKLDIPLLINSFLDRTDRIIDTPLMVFYMSYQWPGNVRELKNEIERICILYPDKNILLPEFSELYKSQREITHLKLQKSEIKHINSVDQSLEIIAKAPGTGKILNLRKRTIYLKKLFEEHKDLTRIEVMTYLEISGPTATRMLNQLIEEDFIEKMKPTAAPRSHYFVLKDQIE